ncbi:SCAN domain-containing protein 3 [Trichinella sp. T6]|nr:SCAN domain-containing protein 3 [Trichinella sp. T6]
MMNSNLQQYKQKPWSSPLRRWHADEGPIGPDAVQPTCLISLTVPKKCAEKFLAGRFVPKTLDKQYALHIPPYFKDHDYEPTRKDSVPDVLAVHCVIHRQHLVAKHLTEHLHCSLGYVIAAINKIRSILLNDRLFSQFYEQNDEIFSHLLKHTEVRWLSKGVCLSRYYERFETILEFF